MPEPAAAGPHSAARLVGRSLSASALVTAGLLVAAALPASALDPGGWFEPLAPGACFDDRFDDAGDFDFSVAPPIVPCDGPHGNEVVAIEPFAVEAYPGEDVLSQRADALCAPRYRSFLGRPISESTVSDFTVLPGLADWDAGVRSAYCIVYGSGPMVGSAASGDLSAPGHVLAAVGEVDGVRDLFLVDTADGSTTNLTRDEVIEMVTPPAWTPDGSALAYAVYLDDDTSEIHRISVDGSRRDVLVAAPGGHDGPAYAPDGGHLAFMSDVDADEFELYVLDLEHDVRTRLTHDPDRDSSVRWSPDGTRLAFRRRTDGVSDIWVMNADGSEPVRLTDGTANDYDPRWSPDGRQLLFTSQRAGNDDIWIMNADGSDQRPLTTHPASDEYPAWSPDGRFIAFHSDRHGGVSLWLMRADGSDVSLLVGQAPLGYPAFAPEAHD